MAYYVRDNKKNSSLAIDWSIVSEFTFPRRSCSMQILTEPCFCFVRVCLIFVCLNTFVMLTAGLSRFTGVHLGSSGQILCWCPPGSLAALVCNSNSPVFSSYCFVITWFVFSLSFVCFCRIPQLLTCLVRREGQKILNLLCNIGRVHPQVSWLLFTGEPLLKSVFNFSSLTDYFAQEKA